MSHAAPTPIDLTLPAKVEFCSVLQSWRGPRLPDGSRWCRQAAGVVTVTQSDTQCCTSSIASCQWHVTCATVTAAPHLNT